MELDKDTVNKLKYYLILAESSRDDPVVEAHCLLKLKKAYHDFGIEMPEKIRNFYMQEIKRISVELKKRLEHLKQRVNEMKK